MCQQNDVLTYQKSFVLPQFAFCHLVDVMKWVLWPCRDPNPETENRRDKTDNRQENLKECPKLDSVFSCKSNR